MSAVAFVGEPRRIAISDIAPPPRHGEKRRAQTTPDVSNGLIS